MKKINVFLVFLISFIYMEILYKIFIYKSLINSGTINMLIFILALSLFLGVLTTLSNNKKTNKIIYFILLFILTVWFCAEYVCKDYFDFYISLSTFGVADQLVDFASKTLIEIIKHGPGIIMFFIPFILSIIFNKRISFNTETRNKILLFIAALIFFGTYLLSLNIGKNNSYSPYSLYYQVNDVSLNMETFGVLNTLFIDIKRSIIGFEDKIIITPDGTIDVVPPKEEEIVYQYNNLNIDFDSLKESESNKTVKDMHDYFSNNPGTLQNEYTGIFKDKNLILFMAESFNDVAVNEKLTPTLYKLVNSGFVFDNFYTPTIYSTIGGEFQELTGLYAESTKILAKFRTGNISFPQGVGNAFKNLNYNVYAYHNNYASFQDRNKYLKSMGFDYFLARGNGLEKRMNMNEWPESDVEMIKVTTDDYINDENFMVFYASVSGHSSYTWASNAQARKHREEYNAAGFNYSEPPASYLAAQMELDRALELLIQKLDEKGILDKTVIALVGDHYPYELTIDQVNEISSYKKDAVVTVNKSNFILWNSEMDTVHVSKVGSQIDVIPTIYNAFGINYDSRLFIGNDILSTTPGLAMFGNRSWVSDKGTYFSASRKFVPLNEEDNDEEYVKNMNQMVNNKITMSKLIIENNYYSKVLN